MWDALSSGIRDNRFRDFRIPSYLKTYLIQNCLSFLFAKLINGIKYVLSLCILCCFVNSDVLTVKTNSRENIMLKSDTFIQGLFLSLNVRMCVCVFACLCVCVNAWLLVSVFGWCKLVTLDLFFVLVIRLARQPVVWFEYKEKGRNRKNEISKDRILSSWSNGKRSNSSLNSGLSSFKWTNLRMSISKCSNSLKKTELEKV